MSTKGRKSSTSKSKVKAVNFPNVYPTKKRQKTDNPLAKFQEQTDRKPKSVTPNQKKKKQIKSSSVCSPASHPLIFLSFFFFVSLFFLILIWMWSRLFILCEISIHLMERTRWIASQLCSIVTILNCLNKIMLVLVHSYFVLRSKQKIFGFGIGEKISRKSKNYKSVQTT